MQTIQGRVSAAGRRIGIAVSRFNANVTARLLEGALEALRAHGAAPEHLTVVHVPGAFELPLAAQRLAQKGNVQAVICLGAVVRGETPHFEYVAAQAAEGIAAVSRACGLPVSFGVITADTMEQAMARAGGGMGNKGYEAAVAALEMADVLERIS
ncbi:MAG TPA: 6,7-dimethyl-8-ribityllumazine synthase [Candidatus Sulfotelmatobacter sp.]|nr:6,7-dimethyl-8-ribityllumazine synthase [Candidatus Sulfotelmatobacter sp.]